MVLLLLLSVAAAVCVCVCVVVVDPCRQRVRPEHLPDLLVSNELGLVMFKDAREEATPAAYGKLLPELDPQVGLLDQGACHVC